MKKYIKNAAILTSMLISPLVLAQQDDLTKKVAELESAIEDLQLENDLKFMSFSGELENRYDYYTASNNITKTGANRSYLTTNFRLNIESRPSERLSFFGRLTMSKSWNDYVIRDDSSGLSSSSGSGGREKGGSELYVERAFMNYMIMKGLTFSAGRLPTIDGPPAHFSSGRSRSGTYPKLVYGPILDGMALTYNMKMNKSSLSTRLLYTPTSFIHKKSDNRDSNTYDTKGIRVSSLNHIVAGMVDFESYSSSWYDRFNFIGQYVKFNDTHLLDASTSVSQGAGQPLLKVNISNLRFGFDLFLLHTELNNIAGTGLDLAVQYKNVKTKSSGGITLATGYDPGVYTIKEEETTKGDVWLVNARYGFLDMFKLGYEFIKVDPGAFVFDPAGKDAIGFYSTPASEGQHVYLNTKLTNNMKLTLGYMTQKVTRVYTLGILGTGKQTDGKDYDIERNSVYTSLTANF